MSYSNVACRGRALHQSGYVGHNSDRHRPRPLQQKTAEHFQKVGGGQLIKLRNLDRVPQLLMNAISDAGQ